MIQLGDRVRDKITGFQGIVIGITDWLYQCRRPVVQPEGLLPDGKMADTQSFDEDQLEVVERGVIRVQRATVVRSEPVVETAPAPETVTAKTGGPRDTPPRQATPPRR